MFVMFVMCVGALCFVQNFDDIGALLADDLLKYEKKDPVYQVGKWCKNGPDKSFSKGDSKEKFSITPNIEEDLGTCAFMSRNRCVLCRHRSMQAHASLTPLSCGRPQV